jgi:hypothetical protein
MAEALADARLLVGRWGKELGHPWSSMGLQRITLTELVQEHMAIGIAALVADAIQHERYQHPATQHFRDRRASDRESLP